MPLRLFCKQNKEQQSKMLSNTTVSNNSLTSPAIIPHITVNPKEGVTMTLTTRKLKQENKKSLLMSIKQ